MNFFFHHFDYSDQHINAVFMPPAIGPSSNYWKMDMESLLCTIIFVHAVHLKLRLKKELTSWKVLVLHRVTFRSPTSVTRFTIRYVSQPPMNSILKHQQLHHQPGNLLSLPLYLKLNSDLGSQTQRTKRLSPTSWSSVSDQHSNRGGLRSSTFNSCKQFTVI